MSGDIFAELDDVIHHEEHFEHHHSFDQKVLLANVLEKRKSVVMELKGYLHTYDLEKTATRHEVKERFSEEDYNRACVLIGKLKAYSQVVNLIGVATHR
ncbi:MAG: hypothetical protein ACK5NC_15020 [Vibrio sp.]